MPIAPLEEICREPIYDYEAVSNEITRLFCIPLGQQSNGRTKTYRDTNLYDSCILPVPQSMLVTGIRCCLFRADGSLIEFPHPLYWLAMLRLDINHKIYWESPIAEVVDPVTLHSAVENGMLSGGRLRNLEQRFCRQLVSDRIAKDRIGGPNPPGTDVDEIDGVFIAQHQSFGVHVEIDPVKVAGVLCVLDGIRNRPIF